MERPRPSIAFVYYRGHPGGEPRAISAVKAFQTVSNEMLDFNPIEVTEGRGLLKGDLDKGLQDVKQQNEKGLLSLIVAPAIDYGEQGYTSTEIVDQVRTTVGEEIPLFVLGVRSEGVAAADNNTFYANPTSEQFLDQVKELRKSSKGMHALRRDTAAEAAALLAAHKEAFPDSDGIDDNTRLVLARLRWGGAHLSPEIVTEEFDGKIPKKKEIETVKDDTFTNDYRKLQAMTDRERRKFCTDRMNELQRVYAEVCLGFAVDIESLVSETTYGFGEHYNAVLNLNQRLNYRDAMLSKGNHGADQDNDPSKKTIMYGKIWNSFESLQTPVLILNSRFDIEIPEEKMRRLGKHLLEQKQFISMNSEFKIIDEDFTYPLSLKKKNKHIL